MLWIFMSPVWFCHSLWFSYFLRFREAELSLTGVYNPINPKQPTSIADEFGSLAGVVLQLLGNIYR